jgi:hypothetical protein
MKQGSFRAVRRIVFLLVTFSIMVFSVHGDEFTQDYVSIILESFSGETIKEWTIGGRNFSYDFEWAVDASKFATVANNERFPMLTYVEAWPMQLFGTNRNNLELRSLGIWGRFDRRGYNWIDIFPIVTGSGRDGDPPQPFEIPIPGRISVLDMWVWGSNHNFYMEAYFRDHSGVVHSLHMGSLAFQGWRNMRVRIPNNIPQARRHLPRFAGLHFVKFRIWTTPLERVDNFFVYFNQMKILTDTFESLFDGDDLADPQRVQEIWARN